MSPEREQSPQESTPAKKALAGKYIEMDEGRVPKAFSCNFSKKVSKG